MIRVKAHYARTWRSWDFQTPEGATAKVNALCLYGFGVTSKAGVIIRYPAHRITKITCRELPPRR